MQGEFIVTVRQVKLTESSIWKNQISVRYWSSSTTLASISKFLLPGPKSLHPCPKDTNFNVTKSCRQSRHISRWATPHGSHISFKGKISVSHKNKLPVSSDSSSSSSSSPDEGESRKRRGKKWSRKKMAHGDTALDEAAGASPLVRDDTWVMCLPPLYLHQPGMTSQELSKLGEGGMNLLVLCHWRAGLQCQLLLHVQRALSS